MSKKTILLVDDEPDLIMMLKQNLEAEGYNIEVAYNGVKPLKRSKPIFLMQLYWML